MKNMYEVKPDESMVSGYPEGVIKYCPYPQSRQSPRWQPKEITKESDNKLKKSKSESPWTLNPKDMSRNREGDKKFYALRPYGDLPDQTFLSPTRGDLKVIPGREGYYDNPNFVMSPNKHRYRHDEDHSSNTSNSRPGNHNSKSKKHCFGAIVIFLLVLLVIIAIGISVYFLNEQMVDNGTMPSRPPPSKLDSESLTADPDFGATIRVTNYDWDSRMADNESDVFRKTASDMEKQLDDIFSKGAIAPLYNYSVVHSISEGSLIVIFTIHLKKTSSDASEIDKIQLEEQKLNLKKIPNIIIQAIKEGLEEIKKEQEQTGVTSSLPVLNIDANAIEVVAVTTTTITPTTSTTDSTTTATTTVATTTLTPTTGSTTVATTTTSTTTRTSSEVPTTMSTPIKDSTATTSTTNSTTSTTSTPTATPTPTTNPSTPVASTATSTSIPSKDSTATATTSTTNPTATTATIISTATNKPTPTEDSTATATTSTTNPSTSPINSTATTTPTSSKAPTTVSTPINDSTATTSTTNPNLTTDTNARTATTSTTNPTTSTTTTNQTTTPTPTKNPTPTTDTNTRTITTSTSASTATAATTSTTIISTTVLPSTTSVAANVSTPDLLCPNLESWKDMITRVCNSSIKAANEASVHDDRCYHFNQAVKCSTWLAHSMKYRCSMQDIRLMYNDTTDWISVTTYQCIGTDMDIIEPFPAPNTCDDLNAFKYIINYECNGNDVDNTTCSTVFDAPECVTRTLNDLQLNCSQVKVTTLLNQHQDSLFNRGIVAACEDKLAPLINGSCYGMSTKYFIQVPPCFQPLRELKDETTPLNTTCRMYLEGIRCLERKANDNETCSATHIFRVLMGQMEYVESQGNIGMPFLLYVYGSAENIRRVKKCQEHMEYLETVANICDDEEYISDTIFSNLCVYKTKQGQNECSITPSDLLQCTIREVQLMDPNCTDTRIEQAVVGKSNETNINSTVCDNEEYCSSALIKNGDALVCLRFLSFINYTGLTMDDTCQFFGEGLECISYFLRFIGVFCQPETLQVPTANFLLHNNYSEFDFNVCKDNLTLEVIPSTRPLCDNDEALLKYTLSTCIQPLLNDVSKMPDQPCTLLTHISYCVTKTLHESVLYCTPVDVATVLIDNADFVQAKYPSLNFTACSVPVFNVSVVTPSPGVNNTCSWDDIIQSISGACPGQLMGMNTTHVDGKCEMLYQLFGCIQSSLDSRGIYCPITLVEEMFKDHSYEVMTRIGINPRSCSDGEPINKTCSLVTQQMIDPNAPEYVMKCFSLVFTSLYGDISYDDACRLLAMAKRCAIKKSNMLGYDCTTETIGPSVKSYTSLVFQSVSFTPDNCTAPIDTRSICEAGNLMSIIATSYPCPFYSNLNDQPSCLSLSLLVECVSMRISTSGMFCSKSIILEYLVDNIDMFELNSTFNFSSCLNKDVIVIPPSTNLRSCSVLPPADVSPLDTCRASIKEFQEAVNDSVKCRILFDVMRCVASSTFYMGYNCTINDIIRLYGSSVLQGFNPDNCDIPSEDDVPRGGNLCTDGAVLEYFINYDCKAYFPDKHSLGFCGSLREMSNCLGRELEMCQKHEIEKMIQAQPFMMYIGSIDDCKGEITTTSSPDYNMSTTPYDRRNTSICDWESILDTASTICHDQMMELAQNDSNKCPKLSSLAQCIHIAMVARDIDCTMSTFLQLTDQNAGYMRQTFNIEVQDCLDDNQLMSPPLYVVERESLCSSSVVYNYLSKVACMHLIRDCNMVQYMECLSYNVMRLTNSDCSMDNYTQYLALDTQFQTYYSKCSNGTADVFNNQCINPASNADMIPIGQCLSPIIILQDRPSCGLYAQSLKCMATKLGMNCTIQLIHQYIRTVFNLVGQFAGNATQMSVIPLIAEQCNDFVSNLTVDTIPDICQDSDQIMNLVKRLPCIPQLASAVSYPCLYLVPVIKQCVQLAANMTGCNGSDIIQIVTTNTEKISDLLPNSVLEKCLGNGTLITDYCPTILPSNKHHTSIRSCLSLSIIARMYPKLGPVEDVCRLDSVAVKCVKEKGRMYGYDCDTESIVPLIESVPESFNFSSSLSCTIDEIEGSICDESDAMVILATGYLCSMTYYNIQAESNCSILNKMTDCVSRQLIQSKMYCDDNKIREGLVSQTERLQTYFNQTGQLTLNFSSCLLATKEISYDPGNMTECAEMLVSGFDPASMCQHALMSLNKTQDTKQQCRVLKDSMTCLVYASQFSSYNCSADDITEMYIKNNTMLSTVYDTLSQSCSGSLEIPRLTSNSMCNTPFTYDYIIRYICSQFIPGNSDRTVCSAIIDLGSCIKSTLSTEFQTTCPSYLIEGNLQHQPFMTYIGSISSCRNQSSGNLPSGCDEVSVNSWYFTDCDQHYTMINQEPERSCVHWERTIHCVQDNVYNDGKYRYCKTKDVLASLLGIELAKVLPNFDPEPCNKEMFANLPDDPCDEMMLYSLAMSKCDPRNSICGQVASIKECVQMELNSHSRGCEDKIDEKLQYLISRDNQECSEGQYAIDDRNRVFIFQNQTLFICGIDWDDTDAEVLCQQLGYSYGVGTSDTDSSQDFIGFTYNCTGNESRLEDCPQYSNRDCFFQYKVAKAFCYNGDTQYGLIDGQSANAGRVTVERNGVKGYLCSGYYDTTVTNAVCRKLGFAAGDDLDDDQLMTKSLDKSWRNTISCPTADIDFAGCIRKAWDVKPFPENDFNYCYKDIAVYCHKKVRLNTAYKNNTGMLMMYVERGQPRQTPVCKDNITQDLVTAQCQYLGFNNGGELLDVNPFLSTFSYYFVNIIACPLRANSIEDCEIAYGPTCTQGPAILHCFINQTMYNDGDMKIDKTGRIWVYKYDLWGTICSKGWNNQAAGTFCRSQGYDSFASRELSPLIYNAIDTKWLYNVSCFGNETGGLLKCSYSTSDDNKECIYADDAGAFCYNQTDSPYFSIRDGVKPNAVSLPNYGRLYLRINGEEGALCAPRNTFLPQVICKQQGYTYGEYYEGELPRPRTTISWRADLRCKRGDTMVMMCFEDDVNWIRVNSSSPSEISCEGAHTVQVYCYQEAWLNTGFLNTTGMITMLDESKQPIVLCENQINREGLKVFCKSIKKSETAQKVAYMQFPGYHATGNIGYNCSGGEFFLSRCQRNTNVHCEGRPVVVRCDDEYVSGSIRDLTMDRDSGRLKLLEYGVYGSMCADQWTDVEADVFCRSYGYIKGYAKILRANPRVPQFNSFKCYGSETGLLDCTHLNAPTKSCDDAAVKCITEADNFTISLEHQNEYQGYGRILISRSGVTSYFCDTGYYLSSSDGKNICRHLGFAESEILDVDNNEPVTSAWEVDFECNSNNVSLYSCINGDWKYESWNVSGYNPSRCRYDIPQIKCSKPVNGIRLPELKTRCENKTIYEMVAKDCDDVIANITLEVRTSQIRACQYFPELVQCLAAKLISENIYCTESQVYSALRQNKPEITSVIGGLNTDNCDGMIYAPKADCALLPLFSQLLPQCYDIPNTMITEFGQIAKLCGQGREAFDCLVQKTREVGYLCTSDDFMNLMAENQQYMTEQFRFNISFCIQNPPQQTTQKTVTTTASSDVHTRCLNSSIYDMVDKDCGGVIDNITLEVQTLQMSACQYFPELVQCLSEKLIIRNITCSETQVFSTLRQNQPEIMAIIGGLNTDNCDGMTFVPKDACTSLPLYTQLLPKCYDAPNSMVMDPIEINLLCMKGFEIAQCLLENIVDLGYTGCTTNGTLDNIMQNPQWAQNELKLDITQCF